MNKILCWLLSYLASAKIPPKKNLILSLPLLDLGFPLYHDKNNKLVLIL